MPRTLSREALVLDTRSYAAQRPERRAAMIPVRRERRVLVGDQLVLEFENAETLQYQVQEMLYVEHAGEPAPPTDVEVSHELEAYSRLLPTSHELAATLFIELDDLTTVRSELARLAGVQDAVGIELGEPGEADLVRGVELPGLDELDEDQLATVSVHMVRFRFTDAQRDRFRDPAVPARLVVDHPEYSADTPLEGAARTSLLGDLALEG